MPRQLLDRATDDQLLHSLVHEKAHFVRRDHLWDMLAFFVASLFWWNPVLWLARRNVRLATETCCDALAVERLSGSRRLYAETLVSVVDFVGSRTPSTVASATGFWRGG